MDDAKFPRKSTVQSLHELKLFLHDCIFLCTSAAVHCFTLILMYACVTKHYDSERLCQETAMLENK